MTTGPQSQCGACQRYRSPFSPENTTGLEAPFCAAFPAGIPDRVYNNELDHRQPIDGDHGLRWLGRVGAVFPEYAFTPDALGKGVIVSASMPVSGAPHTGAMIALVPAAEDAQSLVFDGGEPVDELHCTLLFLGDADQIQEAARAQVVDWCRHFAGGWEPVEATAFAVSMFNPLGDEPCVVLGLSGADLAFFHDELADCPVDVPDQHEPWQPHITLAYSDDPLLVGELTDRCGVVMFDRLRVAFGGEVTDIVLGDGGDDPVQDQPGEPPIVVAAREVWNGCPRCFAPQHDGPCRTLA